MHTIRLTPLEEDAGTRLDSFLSRRVEGLTRSAAARLLAEGCVTCDGAVPGKSYRIAGGEELCVTLPEAEEPEAVPETADPEPAQAESAAPAEPVAPDPQPDPDLPMI